MKRSKKKLLLRAAGGFIYDKATLHAFWRGARWRWRYGDVPHQHYPKDLLERSVKRGHGDGTEPAPRMMDDLLYDLYDEWERGQHTSRNARRPGFIPVATREAAVVGFWNSAHRIAWAAAWLWAGDEGRR